MIQGKIWGSTEKIESNNFFEMHKATIKSGFFCSKHMHKYKWNGFYVEKGVLEIHTWKNDYDLVDITVLKSGDYTKVAPGEYHMFVCKEDCTCIEVYWPELSETDIVRENCGGEYK